MTNIEAQDNLERAVKSLIFKIVKDKSEDITNKLFYYMFLNHGNRPIKHVVTNYYINDQVIDR